MPNAKLPNIQPQLNMAVTPKQPNLVTLINTKVRNYNSACKRSQL